MLWYSSIAENIWHAGGIRRVYVTFTDWVEVGKVVCRSIVGVRIDYCRLGEVRFVEFGRAECRRQRPTACRWRAGAV